MVNLRNDAYGAGAMKGVNLAVIAYDNRVAKDKDGKETSRYLDARLHPGDERAAGQTTLALVTKKDEKSPNGYNNSERYTPGQFDAIVAAAGDNTAPLLNKSGEAVGTIYGVKADVFPNSTKEGRGLVINSKSLEASDLSVGPDANGRDITTQIFDSMKAAKEAKAAEKAAAQVEQPAAEAQAEAPQAANDEPELG